VKKLLSMIVCSSSALLFAPTDAHALGPADVEAGAKVGVGIPLNNAPNTVLGLGFGVGGRAGVTFFNVYAGVAGVYYFGQTKTTNLGITESLHTLMLGIEAGYDLKVFRFLTLRPQLGLGNQEYYVKTNVTPGSDSSYFYLEPAIVGLVPLKNLYVGADIGTRILPAGPAMSTCPDGPGTCHSFHAGLTLHAQVGVRF
jgi:hypothetical protein